MIYTSFGLNILFPRSFFPITFRYYNLEALSKTSVPGYTKCASPTYLDSCKCIKYSFPESTADNGVTVINAK